MMEAGEPLHVMSFSARVIFEAGAKNIPGEGVGLAAILRCSCRLVCSKDAAVPRVGHTFVAGAAQPSSGWLGADRQRLGRSRQGRRGHASWDRVILWLGQETPSRTA
jgi:hypothetical protein